MPRTSATRNRTPRWRGAVGSASTLAAVAGAWIAVSGFVLGQDEVADRWALLAAGSLVVVIGLARALRWYRLAWPSYANAVLGGLVLSFAFWLSQTGAERVSSALGGVIIIVMSLLSASETQRDSS